MSEPTHGNLQPYYKIQPVTLNKHFNKHALSLFYKVNNVGIITSENFSKDIQRLIKPGRNIPPEILSQTKTITDQYTILNHTLYKTEKYLNSNRIKEQTNCEITFQIFKDSTATYLANEIAILAKDLPEQTADISSDINIKQRTSGILMQAILDINEIIFLLNKEIAELENLFNHQVTENTILAVQDSSCIQSTLMEKLKITNVIATKTGLMIEIIIYQFQPSENTFAITPTSYLGNQIDFTNTFLINDQLTTCECTFIDDNIYTGCTCSPFNQQCTKAILSNKIKNLISNCPFIQTQNPLPVLTYTGILFPSYKPYSIQNSQISNSIPLQPDLPFHIQTSNPANIAIKDNIMTLQAAHNLPEELQSLTLSEDDFELLTNFMRPLDLSNIINYISWSMGGFSIIILIPIIFCFIFKLKQHNNKSSTYNNSRRSVNLKLMPSLF